MMMEDEEETTIDSLFQDRQDTNAPITLLPGDDDLTPTPTLEPSTASPDDDLTDQTIIPTSPVTSIFIYQPTTGSDGGADLVTSSLLAGDGLLISTTPVFAETGDVDYGTDYGTDYGDMVSHIPVTVVSQSTIKIVGTATATIDVTAATDIPDSTTDSPDDDDVTDLALAKTTTNLYQDIDGDDETTTEMFDGEKPFTTDSSHSLEDDVITDSSSSLDLEVDLNEEACRGHVCRNGGTCYTSITGAGCRCPLQFRGRQCEEEFDVEVAGFVGHSLLVHELKDERSLAEGGGFQIMLSFKTSSSDGVLFYAEGKIYLVGTTNYQIKIIRTLDCAAIG